MRCPGLGSRHRLEAGCPRVGRSLGQAVWDFRGVDELGPRAESAIRPICFCHRSFGYFEKASTPAFATWESSEDFAPLTPIPPTTMPSTMNGRPPSLGRGFGNVRIALFPASTASSRALLRRRQATAV